jgi:hypothetical protein
VSRPVGDEIDQRLARPDLRIGRKLVHQGANRLDHVEIGLLVAPADAVGRADRAVENGGHQRARVILDIKPVAHVRALAVDRQLQPFERVDDHQRDELFGEMIWAVIVRAVGHDHRQPVGVVPGAHQMVRRGLRGRIGRARIVGRGLAEQSVLAKRAEHLVSRNVVEAERARALGRQRAPVAQRLLQQREGSDHVGLDKFSRPVDRAVDMAFRCQMEDNVRLVFRKRGLECGEIANVGAHKGEAWCIGNGRKR